MKKYSNKGLIALAAIIGVVLLWNFLKPEEKVDFSADVKPIINKHCIACHGGVKKNGGLSLLFEDEAKAVTESGVPSIIPGMHRERVYKTIARR